MDDLYPDKYYYDYKKHIIGYVKHFPEIMWEEGYWEAIITYLERIGIEWSKHHTERYRKLKLFTDEELDMFIDFEKVLMHHYNRKSGAFIYFTWPERDEFEKARMKIVNHFENKAIENDLNPDNK